MEPVDDTVWDAQAAELDASFLQSSLWSRFQEASGLPVHRLQGKGWACLLIERGSQSHRYLLAPYGPTLKQAEAYAEAIRSITAFAREHGAQWVRLEPTFGITSDTPAADLQAPDGITARPAAKQLNPHYTRIVDLSPAEDVLLASISSSTRSVIRKLNKNGELSYRTSRDPADMQLFLDMMHTVSNRNQVQFHPDGYYLQQAETLMPGGHMRLELALQGDKPVAGIVMHDFNKVATYTYAASLPEARELNASALLMWNGAIVNSKAQGAATLDLFGVVPDDTPPDHPWYGFSSFKRKFGGRVVERAVTTDLPLSFQYYPYRIVADIKRRLH